MSEPAGVGPPRGFLATLAGVYLSPAQTLAFIAAPDVDCVRSNSHTDPMLGG